jgi:hypothetical protein
VIFEQMGIVSNQVFTWQAMSADLLTKIFRHHCLSSIRNIMAETAKANQEPAGRGGCWNEAKWHK